MNLNVKNLKMHFEVSLQQKRNREKTFQLIDSCNLWYKRFVDSRTDRLYYVLVTARNKKRQKEKEKCIIKLFVCIIFLLKKVILKCIDNQRYFSRNSHRFLACILILHFLISN